MIILVEDPSKKVKEILTDFGKQITRGPGNLTRFYLPKKTRGKTCLNDFMYVETWTGKNMDVPFYPKAKTIINFYGLAPIEMLEKLEQIAKELLKLVKIFYSNSDFLQAKKRANDNHAA